MSKTYIHKFPTWEEFMRELTTGKRTMPEHENASLDNRSEIVQWAGGTLDEAIGYLQNGWKRGLDRIREVQRKLPPNIFDCVMPMKDYKPELKHSIAGGVIDMGAHLSGATPETFITEERPIDEGKITKGSKLQTIYLNITNSCFTDEDAFFYRGAYTFLLAEHMENCGYSCEIWVMNVISSRGGLGQFFNLEEKRSNKQLTYIKVKEFGELFDTNKLVTSLCSNFFYRRCVFALLEMYSVEERQMFGITRKDGYGLPISNAPIQDITLPEDQDLNPLWINTINTSDEKAMLEKFQDILKKHLEGGVIVE